VLADQALRQSTKGYVSNVKQALLVAFSGQLDTLADFGLTMRSKPVMTPEERLAATAKAKATRAARHTMGSKQKAEIKGTVAPTAPAPTPAPAPTAIPPTVPVPVPAPVAPAPSPAIPAAIVAPTHTS
jgi:hypothetical protein